MRATEHRTGSPEATASKIHHEMREAHDEFDLASGRGYISGHIPGESPVRRDRKRANALCHGCHARYAAAGASFFLLLCDAQVYGAVGRPILLQRLMDDLASPPELR